ncbi:MAG: PDZ domain-containing protein [Nitrosomonadales bacterium]
MLSTVGTTIIGKLVQGGAGQQAGLREGDRVARVNGRAIVEWKELVEAVRNHPAVHCIWKLIAREIYWCLM